MVEALDYCVGNILGALDRLGIADDTIVVLYSDHGIQYYSNPAGASSNTGGCAVVSKIYRKRRVYEESIKVPLYVRYPRAVAPGTVSDAYASTVDVLPTLLGLAGFETPADLIGVDFSPALRGEVDALQAGVFDAFPSVLGSGYVGNTGANANQLFGVPWRGVLARREESAGSPTEWSYAIGENRVYELLFDNTADPFQTKDLSGDPAYAGVRSELLALCMHYARVLGDDDFAFE
jgi:arylsulfatase A-like enzyme